MSTRQQEWSLKAHTHVSKFEKDTNNKAKLKTLCMKFPSLVQQAGLIQALVFVEARFAEPGKVFLDAVAGTYGETSSASALRMRAQNDNLPEYLALSRDITAVSVWFRRFAQVLLRDVEGTD
ncbi:MAG: type III-B CRISPR module-associated protein Cmr5 [Myxococcales bacterium]|nr:type III-B CRISPR module-associated protein Cmr5 [Myxococcales bacterium]